ncbi:Phage terminase-like protein, large subunit, contains N-terminal HTH domain [Faunimonas pinastri]|uniref:Phage terminase-like protein, large subunit, contains N-terminal HTH domain n=1 Tax=Faunimonas pinastri TaxID=1855383 RepID=A0A1H9F611_9HYPH|nr:terminase large subunit [Faunimonas pinastri]SEQ33424.1 Phage terminase-like protein, large subunit, contains N-terminal HTH domain [Faunimonas pinastri]
MPERLEDGTTAYAEAVVAKDIVAGPLVRAACQRHLADLERGPDRGLFWDLAAAERAIGFFRDVLTVEVELPGDDGGIVSKAVPFVLQPWQAFIVGSLFGWKNAHGFRRFRRGYCEIGKGNGKSPLAAGIGHYMCSANGKLRAEIYSAATDRDQAAILFRDAVAMWERSRALKRRLEPSGLNPVWQLTHTKSGSFFKPISSEKKGKSGIRPYCALIDEVHEHRDNSVIEMLRAGTKGNQEALIFEITNSGFDRKSVCWQEHEYSTKVVTGVIENDAWFTFICSLDEGDDPFADEDCWVKANPNLGISIQKPFIREQVQEAVGMPSKDGLVRRLHFCVWTESETAAIPRRIWEACQGEVDPDELTDRGVPCFGGLDLSRTRDLTAFTLTWVLEAKRDAWRFASRTWFWTPADTLVDRARIDRAPYDLWAKQGHMEPVPGNRVSYRWVASALASLCARYDPLQIGCDQYGLENLGDQLDDIGVTLPCVVHPQGFRRRVVGEKDDGPAGAEDVALWMPDSINKLEAALLETRIVVDPNPVMTMCAAGVVFEQNRTGHRMFDKDKATSRIDGMVSLAMSIGVATIGETGVNLDQFLANPIMVI